MFKLLLVVFSFCSIELLAVNWVVSRVDNYVKYKNLNHDTHYQTLKLIKISEKTIIVEAFFRGRSEILAIFKLEPDEFPLIRLFDATLAMVLEREKNAPDFRSEALSLLVSDS